MQSSEDDWQIPAHKLRAQMESTIAAEARAHAAEEARASERSWLTQQLAEQQQHLEVLARRVQELQVGSMLLFSSLGK